MKGTGGVRSDFFDEDLWKIFYHSLNIGNYVFTGFGHNDEKSRDPACFTNPLTAFRHNLIRYISEARFKGATLLLLTPVVRRNFNEYGVLTDTHVRYSPDNSRCGQRL